MGHERIAPAAELIRAARDASGLSQERVAAKAGISTAAYDAIEKGRATPKIGTLRRVCEALGLPFEVRLAGERVQTETRASADRSAA